MPECYDRCLGDQGVGDPAFVAVAGPACLRTLFRRAGLLRMAAASSSGTGRALASLQAFSRVAGSMGWSGSEESASDSLTNEVGCMSFQLEDLSCCC